MVIMNKPLVFTFGAAVGAVAALLLSPNSGERNREIVADKVDYYTSHGEQVLQQTADTVRSKVRGVADTAGNADADDIREKINEARGSHRRADHSQQHGSEGCRFRCFGRRSPTQPPAFPRLRIPRRMPPKLRPRPQLMPSSRSNARLAAAQIAYAVY